MLDHQKIFIANFLRNATPEKIEEVKSFNLKVLFDNESEISRAEESRKRTQHPSNRIAYTNFIKQKEEDNAGLREEIEMIEAHQRGEINMETTYDPNLKGYWDADVIN